MTTPTHPPVAFHDLSASIVPTTGAGKSDMLSRLALTHAPVPVDSAPRAGRPGRAPDVWPDGVDKLAPIPAPNLPPRVFEGDTRGGDRRDRTHVLLILAAAVLAGGPAGFGLWATGLTDASTAVACGFAALAPALAIVALVLFRQPPRHGVTFTIPEDGVR